ncbi:16S rRNA (adenine(1518)-N(6)/adenine(1519)-N(6))-dimethyltransferase RsmA [Ferruginivarius sediminum]|uniref:Ribosomal RNA small subunit methyltransferase A n=1 Tax=Ferruginivarius sediminum TaxID=2661937 RepID=A0A369TDE4_9PROT|nr:16S rRNA (adenine(1518)-N(6)/adenine(1519)-N(6))-dimethyltransferase RsmA [Ferruginivarius sediminum]RDD62405.1 16S rRNA (adenine(1518)-N(6)/adenine(1519)-N(6))-dimethyltransferase RsmA [Ferruginivarius sediminum]
MPEPGDSLPPLRETIARHDLRARRSLGQHFLLDLNLTGRIARAAGDLSAGTTVEVGPGPGGLTRALLAHGARHVLAVERDSRCLAALEELAAAYPGRLETVEADALELRLDALGGTPRHVVANLPYNISTQLLVNWLLEVARNPGVADGFTLMFQKEVADRLVARPNTKDYGRLSVLTQWLCQTRVLFNVPKSAFTPPPKIDSSVVQLVPRAKPAYPADPETLQQVTAAAFGQRRKMLRQSLKSLAVDPAALTAAAGVTPTARAETLAVADFCALARALAQMRESRPNA